MPAMHTQEIFSFEPDKIKAFHDWLRTDAAQQKGTDFRIKLFFKWLGINLAQKQQNALLIQHYIGLGLRQLALNEYRHQNNPQQKHILQDLETINRESGEIRYGFLNSDVASCLAGLFGIQESPEGTNYIKFEQVNKKIFKVGNGHSAHFHLEGSTTIGNGNCLLNAMAQLAAEHIGFKLVAPDSEEISSYIRNTISSESVDNSNVSLQENFGSEEVLEDLKSLKQDSETFTEIVKAADFKGSFSKIDDIDDFDLRKLLAEQKEIYAQIQGNKISRVFENHQKCSEPLDNTSGSPVHATA